MQILKIKKLEKTGGITLIALVITIIILLILAGITILTLTGENGLLNRAKTAGERNKYTTAEEKVKLAVMSSIGINGSINDDLLKENINNIEGLQEKVNEIKYDLIIKVDGYEFKISRLGKVTSTGNEEGTSGETNSGGNNTNSKDTTIKEFSPTIRNINGTYFTIEANATSSDSTIVAYEYFVNGKYIGIYTDSNTFNTIDVNNLELNTEYEIYAVAIDDKGTMRKSNIVKQKTLDKLYLYKNGDECDQVTGGWICGTKSNAGTGSKNENHLYLNSPAETSRYTTYIFRTNNKINISKFNSIHVIVTIKDLTGDSSNIVGMFNDEYSYYGSWVSGVITNNGITNQYVECTTQEFVKELDKTNVDEYGFAGTVAGGGAIGEKSTMLVYEMWLE